MLAVQLADLKLTIMEPETDFKPRFVLQIGSRAFAYSIILLKAL